jgi:ADP-heptose:LPS heptosyltransferase
MVCSNWSEARSAPPPRRILIVLLGSIGDVVRALPLLGRLRRAYPNAHIAWAVEPKSKSLLEAHHWLDELIIFDRERAPWSFLSLLGRVRNGRFDLVIDLQRHLKSGLVTWASGAPDRIGFAKENAKEFNYLFSTRHIAPQPRMRLKLLQYQAFGDALELAPAPIEFGLRPAAEELAHARELLASAPAPRLGIILGSSWPSRLYFPDAIAAVARQVAESANGLPGLRPVLLGGAAEVGLAAEVEACANGLPLLNLVGKTSLRELSAVFTQCAAAFGPDSGPMHIAAAVGCPIVSLWGATAPERSAPWGFAEFALKAAIPCHPCYLRRCPIERECMRRIEPEAVAEAVRRALKANLGSVCAPTG